MKLVKWKQLGVYLGIAALGAAASLLAVRASAAIPDANVLTYTGYLAKPDGTPYAESAAVGVSLWDAAEDGKGNEVCSVPSAKTPLVAGRFQVSLPDDCTKAVRANGNLWVETSVDGISLGRTSLGAVPYAVSAESADRATGTLAQQVVPAGAVMAFDLDACPAGWTALASAKGRAIVGTTTGLARGALVGNDSLALSTAQIPAHSHKITDPGHAHSPPGTNFIIAGGGNPSVKIATDGGSFNPAATTANATTGITGTDAAGGGEPFDNRQASLALLYCKKN